MLMSKMDIQLRILWILYWQIICLCSVFRVQVLRFVFLFLFVSNVDLLVMGFSLNDVGEICCPV